jgi:hypothetical protein
LTNDAVETGDLSWSWAEAIARWTRELPAGMRDETNKILLEAAAVGASRPMSRFLPGGASAGECGWQLFATL